MTAPTEIYGTTQTVSTTERSLPLNANYSSGSPVATPMFITCFISIVSMAAGDAFQFKIYEKVLSGSAAQIQIGPLMYLYFPETTLIIPGLALLRAWDITALKLTGTDRAVEFSARGYS